MHMFRCKKINKVLKLPEVNLKQEEWVEGQKESYKHVDEHYPRDELEEGEQRKKKEAKKSEKVGENMEWKEDVNAQKNKELKYDNNLEKIQQLCRNVKENVQEQGPDNIKHEFVSEDREERSISDEDKSCRDPLEELKSVWTCRVCGRSARGHLNHTCLYCFSPF